MGVQVHYILMTAAALILFTSLFIKKIHKSIFSEPLLVMLAGFVLNLMDLHELHIKEPHSLMNMFSRITIIVALTSTALRLKHSFLMEQKRNLSIFIPLAMVGMWLSSALLFYLFIEQDVLFSLLIGAMITPTDPVVASSMVTGSLAEKLLPRRIRSGLSFEAGVNDGLAFPMVMLPFLLIIYPGGFALQEFFVKVVLWENVAGVVLAAVVGYLLGKVFHYFHKRKWMDNKATIGFALAMTFFIYALFEVLHTNSIISVFAAAFAFNSIISRNEAIQEESVQEVFERILVVPIFFLFGLVAPWESWLDMGSGLLLFAVVILLFRRLPVFILLRPLLKGLSMKDLLVMGWFGPIGVAALFYALHLNEKHHFDDLWTVVSFIVFASTLVHGFTRYAVSMMYYKSNKEEQE